MKLCRCHIIKMHLFFRVFEPYPRSAPRRARPKARRAGVTARARDGRREGCGINPSNAFVPTTHATSLRSTKYSIDVRSAVPASCTCTVSCIIRSHVIPSHISVDIASDVTYVGTLATSQINAFEEVVWGAPVMASGCARTLTRQSTHANSGSSDATRKISQAKTFVRRAISVSPSVRQ